MPLNRRTFSLQLATLAAAAGTAPAALAQGGPVLGTHYTRLAQPGPVAAPAGKVEVTEFFMYSCPHCNALEPGLEAWAKTLPPDVVLRRVPVAFGAAQKMHQQLFFALESLGQIPALHRKVFLAIHGERKRMDKEPELLAWAQANGLEGAKLAEALNSFTVQTRVRQAAQLAEAYKIDSVPTFAVQGRHMTSVGQAGSEQAFFATLNFLVQQAKAGK